MAKSTHRLLITYDLQEPNSTEEDYADLYEALDGLRAKRIQESVWVVQTSLTPSELMADLQDHFHLTDRILIVRMNGFRSRNGEARISLT
jgi:hypothetical protein